MKIKKGDKVKMLSGKDRGKTGTVSLVRCQPNGSWKLIVEGLNKVKKHQRPRKQGQKGQIITVERLVAASAVQIVCGGCGRGTRIGWKQEGESKTRVCKKCGASLN